MSGRVFISYRRDDSAGHAGRVHDRLTAEFGRDLLFMDVDAIPLGSNFSKILSEEVGKCDALLAVIGPTWLDVRDEAGQRRLDDPTDFVRVEIAAALQRDIPVIPILLEGTRIPKAGQLPENLKELAQRNGLDVRHVSFHADMDKLIQFLRSRSGAAAPPASSRQSGRPAPDSGKTEEFTDPEMVVVPAGSNHFRRDTGNNRHAEPGCALDLTGIWSGTVSHIANSYNYEWFMTQEGQQVSGTIALSNTDGSRRSVYFFVGDIRENKLYFRGTKWFYPPEVEWCIAAGELNIPAPGSSYNELRGTWGPGPPDVENPCPSGGGEIYLRRKEPL